MARLKKFTQKVQTSWVTLRTRRNAMIPKLIIPGILFFLLTGCKKTDYVTSSEEVKSYFVGQNYGGGKIFFIDKSGMHGLIASGIDQSTGAMYVVYQMNYLDYPTTNAISATDGSKNTTMIINVQGNQGVYAAKLARDYSGGGFNDWFLPSKDQLHELYLQRALVGGFANEYYWSSTEFDKQNAWSQVFGGVIGGNQYHWSKGLIARVRAIREF